MRFKGKVAVWWYLIIAALNAVLVWMIVKYGLHYISYFYILPAGLLDLYLIPVCFANYVEIDKKKLFIRFGISKEELLIEDITAMHRADRLTLSYCASTDVVLLGTRNKKNVVVSLKDNQAFMDALLKANKKIKRYI
ncbi:PH domain-containing protein [Mordavella massiliensis]|uniref:PH domain-containing protein n=1 Tax=Mordavella massiliensis TaxID=1871024 RepID=A0A938X396_9CLOT|nr:PH domain-containing protein [Mordavella massiliensis]MBM6827617.1 PH domain-containing protein [Mordavella massiliensis]